MQLTVIQRLSGNVQRRGGGVKSAIGAPLLLHQQVSLIDNVLDLAVQLSLPEVDIVQPLGQTLRGQRLSAIGGGLGLLGHAVRLPAILLGQIAIRERLIIFGIVAVVPLLRVVFVDAEAHGGLALIGAHIHAHNRIELGLVIVDRLIGAVAWIVAGKVGFIGR